MNESQKQRQINELKGEIEAKESALVSSQIIYEQQLKNGLGDEMKKVLTQMEPPKKKSVWKKLLDNIRKLLTNMS